MIFAGIDRLIINIGNAFCFLGAITCWMFVICYWWRLDWWRTETGVHLMAVTGGMGIILTYVSWRIIWPITIPTRNDLIARALIFGIEFLLAAWRLVIFIRRQKQRSRGGKRRQTGHRSGGRHSS